MTVTSPRPEFPRPRSDWVRPARNPDSQAGRRPIDRWTDWPQPDPDEDAADVALIDALKGMYYCG